MFDSAERDSAAAVAIKNSISSNSGLAMGFLKTLAVPIRQNGAGFIFASGLQRCWSPIVECPRAAIGAGGDWPVGVSGRLPFVQVMKPADLRDRRRLTTRTVVRLRFG